MAPRRLVVLHEGYGCATGCCGHIVRWDDDQTESMRTFDFGHPWPGEDVRAWAERLLISMFGAEHVSDLDWEHSEVYPAGQGKCWNG